MKKHHSCNEAAVHDIIQACKRGVLSWEEVAKKALVELADVWKQDLNELFFDEEDDFDEEESIDHIIQNAYDDEDEYYEESLKRRIESLERKLRRY